MNVNEYLFAKATAAGIPLSGSFELTPVCNFQCPMCYLRKTPKELREGGEQLYNAKQWLALAQQCRDAGMLYLLLTGGEPFLYPEFRPLYEELHRMGFAITINSNASLIDEETIEWLALRSPARVNVTLYGMSEKTYGAMCGQPSAYARVRKAVEGLLAAGIPVTLNVSVAKENADDLQAIQAFAMERGLYTRINTYMVPPTRRACDREAFRLTPLEAAMKNIERVRNEVGDKAMPMAAKRHLSILQPTAPAEDSLWGADCGECMRCYAGRCAFFVNWRGEMTACGLTRFPVVKHPFEEAFANCFQEISGAVRTTKVLQACHGCERKELCHPCVAVVEAETGDVNGKPAYLCELSAHLQKLWEAELRRSPEEGKEACNG